ncbi:S8 family peptidase [Chloroflexia bacterium SDU3-3]|nr:S8 family peptidase [Chloroflexia bacterium SDU3-3]
MMRRPACLFALALLAAAQLFATPAQAARPLVPVRAAPAEVAAPGRYIVTLKSGVRPAALLAQRGLLAHITFHTALNGFVADMTPAQLRLLQATPGVAAIEQDQRVAPAPLAAPSATTQPLGPADSWGLDRIDQRDLPLSGSYTYTSTGASANVYIFDADLNTALPEFGGRASLAYDAVGTGVTGCSRGTQVAATIGSSTYGVAKQAKLYLVRVQGCGYNESYVSQVIDGVDWLTLNHKAKAVADISFNTLVSPALNLSLAALSLSGVFVVAPAGDSYSNACLGSPPSEPSVFTVSASTSADKRYTSANGGLCVDIFAPGAGIRTLSYSGAPVLVSDTYIAAPHVAGIAAMYKDTYGDLPSTVVFAWILANATPDAIPTNQVLTTTQLLANTGGL